MFIKRNKAFFEKKFSSFLSKYGGVVLDLDRKKAARTEWRYARIRVGMCDPKLLSYFDWMRYCDQNGYWSRYDIQFEVEGRGSGSDKSGDQQQPKIYWNEQKKHHSAGSATEGSSQAPQKSNAQSAQKNAPSGKGKDPIQYQDEPDKPIQTDVTESSKPAGYTSDQDSLNDIL